jgi:hypothetical protein
VTEAGFGAFGLEEQEESGDRLTRTVTLFVPRGQLFRRQQETYVLRLYAPEAVEELLGNLGFAWVRLPGYEGLDVGPGWHAFAATRR